MPIVRYRYLSLTRELIIVGLLGCLLLGGWASPTAAEEPAADRADVSTTMASDAPSGERTAALLGSITVFVLAIFVGFEVIAKVPPTLHTPLMSGSNAISGITLVGSVLTAGVGNAPVAACLGCLAVILATVNVVGGFLVTERMLSMFKKK